METVFRDKMLVCKQCQNEFVYTIGQQRQAYEEHGTYQEPERCPVCEVKQERGGQEEAMSMGSAYRQSNGASHASYTSNQSSNDSSAATASPNRPTEYRSGTDHPLHGHGGESFTGRVKWFNDRKGFGFITLDNGIEIFVHYSGITGEGYKTLKQDQRVRVLVEDTDKGPQASQVTPLSEEAEEEQMQAEPMEELGD